MSKESTQHQLTSQLAQLVHYAKQRNHRASLILSGSREWVTQQIDALRDSVTPATIISDDAQLAKKADRCLPAKAYRSLLGTETDLLIWDAFSSLHPDGFAACSGILKGGGLLVILMPEPETFKSLQDPSYKEMLDSDCVEQATARFKSRFFEKTQKLELSLFVEQGKAPLLHIEELTENPLQACTDSAFELNDEQQSLVKAVQRVALGHRKRPLVLTADRGRGKSTALGIALARLINEHRGFEVLIPRSSKESINILLTHFKQHVQSDLSDQLKVIAPDALLDEQPSCNLVVVDEAAALPLSILEKIVALYPRCVFSSTQHGYEGSGRGFDLKLDSLLKPHSDRINRIALNQPTRWASNDPLEAFVFDTFALDASLSPSVNDAENQTFRWLEKSELAADDSLLKSVFALLVLAHYQTRPSDLRLILDHPRIHVGIMESLIDSARAVSAAVLCIEEGGINANGQEADLVDDIISGQRRLRGHLVAQSLAQSLLSPEWSTDKSLRIVRIVVNPELRRRGLGQNMLSQTTHLAAELDCAAVTVSYGIEAGLLDFWKQADFSSLKLGYAPDASNGAPSVMMAKALCTRKAKEIHAQQVRFLAHLINGASLFYKDLETEILVGLLNQKPGAEQKPEAEKKKIAQLKPMELKRLQLVAATRYPIYDAWPELQQLFLSVTMQGKIDLQDVSERACIDHFIKGLEAIEIIDKNGFQGKKDWERTIRQKVGELLQRLD